MKAIAELVFPKDYEEEIIYHRIDNEDVSDALEVSIQEALPDFKVKIKEIK